MAYLNTDIPELIGSDTATCLANLDLLGVRGNRVTESMLAMLSELADAILRDAGGDPDTVDSILLSLQGTADEAYGASNRSDAVSACIQEQVAEVNRDLIGRISVHAGVNMRLILYRLLSERMPPNAEPPFAEPLTDAARGRIAYMAGAFANKAYLRLASYVPRARSATFHSFVDTCEEVRGGLCEYGILPLENTQSGKLTAFSRLIIRYGLCIVAVCDLENGAAPGQSTRFALVKKAPDRLFPAPKDNAAPLYVELLHTMDTPSLAELLTAASFCGLTLCRADTLPRFEELTLLSDETDDAPLPVCCVLDATNADLVTFRRYLELELSEDILMGLYTALPEHENH